MTLFDLAAKRHKILELENRTMAEDFWSDPNQAKKIVQDLNDLKNIVDQYDQLHQEIVSLDETQKLMKTDYDAEIFEILTDEYQDFLKQFSAFEMQVLLSHEYDKANAILEIHPGAGGTESCDWASMLYRMYLRWAEDKNFNITILDYLSGDEAGLKSVSILIEGAYAYGYLKSEKGVHRLVRISPFDSGGRRHTSFASVELMPEFKDEIELDIRPEDLHIETKRASGAGGQHVNRTDSAVRIVHIPTGLVATSQSGRSQHDNKDEAMKILKSRIYQKMIEEKEDKMREVRGEVLANEWGSQIRSYVFHPYSLIKDLRTAHETSDVQGVMDGDLDPFIYAYLKWSMQK